jgi:hypothetical protein
MQVMSEAGKRARPRRGEALTAESSQDPSHVKLPPDVNLTNDAARRV